ncbi:hypothetical protein D1159_03665 [Pseudoflavonifractor sp. 524-17]|nr:hypothetical protein [Pseudoflavonifractor sp. 524-17]
MGFRKKKEIEFRNRSEARRRENSLNWNGGRRHTAKGYVQILMPEHPRADSSGYVMEHIVVWENATRIPVPNNCCVHHLNGDKSDNRIENLCLMDSIAHTKFHHIGSKRSEKTKLVLSKKAKERFADKRNHPFYKDIDVAELVKRRGCGEKVSDICAEYGISKSTFYCKLKEAFTQNAQ